MFTACRTNVATGSSRVAVLLLLPLLLSSLPMESNAEAERPNILFIMVDDMGYGDWGSFGGSEIYTPRIDQLADEGVRFTEYYVNATVCSPTRAALLTSRFPVQFALADAYSDIETHRGLPELFPTLPQILARRGDYRTAHIGKWHLGRADEDFGPERRGFEYSVMKDEQFDPTAPVRTEMSYRIYDHAAVPPEQKEKICNPNEECGSHDHQVEALRTIRSN